MAPSKITDHTADKANRISKQTISRQRSITAEEMDSSRMARRTDTAMSPTPEPATAAMVDVSAWAQRGLVLENKDLRRTLEMTKSAHAAQLAQIAKRQRTEKEELEVKLEAELCRQEANQRNLNELAANLEEARKENAKLVEKDQALHKQLTARIEENKKLAGELQQADNVIKSTQEEVDTLTETQKELIARENRVAIVLNEQHSKVMNLSKAYHTLETDNKQLQASLESANSELARLKARMSGILDTLASVVRDNGEAEESEIRPDGKAAQGIRTTSLSVAEGRQRSRSSDQRALGEWA
jgi:chromosome segregation ATPase